MEMGRCSEGLKIPRCCLWSRSRPESVPNERQTRVWEVRESEKAARRYQESRIWAPPHHCLDLKRTNQKHEPAAFFNAGQISFLTRWFTINTTSPKPHRRSRETQTQTARLAVTNGLGALLFVFGMKTTSTKTFWIIFLINYTIIDFYIVFCPKIIH